jgi:hypothetical protein
MLKGQIPQSFLRLARRNIAMNGDRLDQSVMCETANQLLEHPLFEFPEIGGIGDSNGLEQHVTFSRRLGSEIQCQKGFDRIHAFLFLERPLIAGSIPL